MNTPRHLWIVGVLSLLWNAGGSYDYVMTQTQNDAYLAAIPAERLDMLAAAPFWYNITWALGVWFSVAGSLFLLLRSRWAGASFGISLLGLILSSIYIYVIATGAVSALAVAGPVAIAFTIAIPLILVALWIYARAMVKRGVLA